MATPEPEHTTNPACKCISKCPTSRSLVVCIDGTSNHFGTKNTNVVKLCSQIVKNDTQLTCYIGGLGSSVDNPGPSANLVSNMIDMAFGRNLHIGILAAYTWLSDNYRDGDRIYLFGKIFKSQTENMSDSHLRLFTWCLPGSSIGRDGSSELYMSWKTKSNNAKLAEEFKKTFCRKHVRVHFVGVWDTVSSVGSGRNKMLPCTTSPCEHICYFRHALALDERRVKFLPEYALGGRSETTNDDRIKEVWFAGTHSDTGHSPLLWMRSQAIAAGLDLEPADVMWNIVDLEKQITPSLKGEWWLLELFPFQRLLYCNSDAKTSTRPHLGGPRIIVPGQKVHVSVLFKNNYRPYAQFYRPCEKWPDPLLWNDPKSQRHVNRLSHLWEKDVLDDGLIQTLLTNLAESRGEANLDALDRLAFVANFGQ
ncbi:hypothetical protein BU15DRAFT_46764 [Melanogaster broomeanus]|nr:hypothetical protein BU15DRAFT_46764 [Melanogaster broomeanus]